jgi:hypothetical protein
MTENTSPEMQAKMESCMKGGKTKEECTQMMKNESSPAEKAETTLLDRITGVMEDVMKAKLETFEKRIDDKIESILKAKEIEIEQALRKSFGTEKDPTIHASDLMKAVREEMLKIAETQKKTPAAIEKAGPEGAGTAPNPIDNLMKQYGMGGKA